MAKDIAGARVGRIHAGFTGLAALAVVGQGAVHPARRFVDGQPFWAVHFGGAQQVAGLAGFDQNFALICKPVAGRQGPLAVHQWQPFAFARGIKAGYKQGAFVQQVTVGFGAAGLHAARADEFVNVFKPGVFARVHHRTLVTRQCDPGAFVGSTT